MDLNGNTLYIKTRDKDIYIKNKDESYLKKNIRIKNFLNEVCIYYGSTLKGRVKASREILNNSYKLPIIVSEKNKIILFPIKTESNEYWINFNYVNGVRRVNKDIEIEFVTGDNLKINTSISFINHQLLKSSRLWFIFSTR